ncbi:MAG: dihydroorotase [Bacteroidota bacterium]
MRLLMRSVRVIESNKEEYISDLLVVDGIIHKIGNGIKDKDALVFDVPGACVSPGWVDLRANFRDPGEETKETIQSGLSAAAHGGFTGVVLMPSTNPPIQTKADVEYLLSRSSGHAVNIYPCGVLSHDRDGKDISEMFDMKTAGAVAFGDDKRPVRDSGLMSRALQYSLNIGSVVMTYSDDSGISGKGIVNEGVSSTISGLKSSPAFAEELMVARDIEICRYTGGRLHFGTISTKGSVDRIRAAKKDGLPITADVCAHQLFFDDSVITDYDTNYKVKPPFRSSDDIESLKLGVMDGTIDAICSDHYPQDDESKNVEFDFAGFGIAGIETAFSVSRTALVDLSVQKLMELFTFGPRRVLGLEQVQIKEGHAANLTVFHPEQEWTPSKDHRKSLSANNPFFGMTLKGKVLGVLNNGQWIPSNRD